MAVLGKRDPVQGVHFHSANNQLGVNCVLSWLKSVFGQRA